MALEATLIAGDVDEAQSLLAIVADAPPGHVPPYLRAQLSRYRALAAIARAVSTSQIEADLRSAADALRELGYLYWLARAQADLGRWLAGEGRSAEAEPMLSEAHEVLTELGALPDLERLRQLERVAGG
jgi:chaperonin cofactor prefoldin